MKSKLNPSINNKIAFKKAAGACRICGETDYNVLDVHRITPGEEGGKYTKNNSVCICSNCHRKVHAGELIIDRYYACSNGTDMLRIIENGQDKFI